MRRQPNEIDAIPKLLGLVDISGAIITIDAMGTQKEIPAQIINPGGDYKLTLEGNQGTLHRSAIQYADQLVDNDFARVESSHFTTTRTAHGRKQTRFYTHLPVPESLLKDSPWKKCRSIGVAITASTRDGKETVETRYYISSLPVGVKQFALAVRGHWGIENSCHWSLDMTFREDESRIRELAIRENFSWMSRFLLLLLNQQSSKNRRGRPEARLRLSGQLPARSPCRTKDLVAAGPDGNGSFQRPASASSALNAVDRHLPGQCESHRHGYSFSNP